MRKTLLTLLALMGLCIPKVHSNAMEDVVQQNLGAFHNVAYAVANVAQSSNTVISSGTIGMTLYYTGTASESDINITQSSITFYAPYPTVDTTVGQGGSNSTGYYDFTVSSMTVGVVCASINQSANYKCLLGGLRSDQSPKLLLDQSAQLGNGRNLKSSGGYQVGIDTGGVTGIISAGLLGPTTTYMLAVGMTPSIPTHRVVLRKCTSNTNDATGLNLRVFGLPRYYEGTTTGPGQAPVTATAFGQTNTAAVNSWGGEYNDAAQVDIIPTTVNTDSSVDYTISQGSGMGLEFAKGAHVVVQTGGYLPGPGSLNGSTTPQSNTNYLRCIWDEKP